MIRVIINADDFGMREESNQAIYEAHQAGRLNSASLLVDGAAVETAVQMAHQCPNLGVGLHLNVDQFFGFDIDGYYGRTLSNVNPDRYREAVQNLPAIEADLDAQFSRFTEFGLTISHVDSHHNPHLLPEIFQSVVRITNRYGVRKMRFYPAFYEDRGAIYESHRRILDEHGFKVASEFRNFSQVESIMGLNESVTELMAHLDKPGPQSEPWCVAQFERLMSVGTWQTLQGQGAVVSSYRDL